MNEYNANDSRQSSAVKFCSSEVRTEAPSDIDDEFAAVIVPSALNAGRRDDIFSSLLGLVVRHRLSDSLRLDWFDLN